MGLQLCKPDKAEAASPAALADSVSSLPPELSEFEEHFTAIAPCSPDLVQPCIEEELPESVSQFDKRFTVTTPCSPNLVQPCIEEDSCGVLPEPVVEKEEKAENRLPDYSVNDSLGVPWYEPNAGKDGKHAFIRGYFSQLVPSPDGIGYVTQKRENGQLQYALNLVPDKRTNHPLPTFSRRTTMNFWVSSMMDSMFISGLRLAVLQANLQVLLAMVDNATYDEVPNIVWSAMAAALGVAVVLWVILGASRAYKYRQFIHPDTRFNRFLCHTCSTLLSMFAVPNDIILIPIHVLPVEQGGLCSSVDLVEGCYRWPVFTITHSSKPDHDYTNASGLTVQLPLFLIVDIGCTAVHIIIAVQHGSVNYTSLVQLSLCTAYAIIKLYEALHRLILRRQLLGIWLRTATDTRMPERMQFMAMNKYLAEGGTKRKLEEGLRKSSVRLSERMPNKEWTKRSTALGVLLGVPDAQLEEVVKATPSNGGDNSDTNVEDYRLVPWYRSSVVTQTVSSRNRRVKFVNSFFIDREVGADGEWGPKQNGEFCEYRFGLRSSSFDDYPPPYYYRRLTLNVWQELLTSSLAEAALRHAGLQATIFMAIMMVENPLYQDMQYSLYATFVSLLCLAFILWGLIAYKVAMFAKRFLHPDSKWAYRKALLGAATLAVFSTQGDVLLLPLQLPPINKGGICEDSMCIEGNRAWPVHSLVHQSKLDHDYMNTTNVFLQLPLFLLVDIGCTCLNLAIALDLGVFNYTTLLQMCTSGTYAFIKVYKIARQLKIKKRLVPLWLRMATDPFLAEHKRLQAVDKYVFANGNKKALAKARREAGLPSPTPRGQMSTSIDSL